MIFLMKYIQSNVAYAISRLSYCTHNPSEENWDALIQLLKHLRGTMDGFYILISFLPF